jgi:tripeptidyl-peptidase-1
VAASSASGDVITTGGGFSGYWSTPAWQAGAVTSFIQGGASSGSGFNPRGRGYPDVALIGVGYQVVVQGQFYNMYGTSASTPVLAGMVTLVNLQRARRGKGPVGFLNPTLYATRNAARLNDVTSGSPNNCCSSMQASAAICCQHGFDATEGWDPLTGLGTVSYPALLDMFL